MAVVLLGLYGLWTVCVNVPGVASDGAVAHRFAYETESLDTACTVEVDRKRLCTVTWATSGATTSTVYELNRTGRCWNAVPSRLPGPLDSWPQSVRACTVLADNLRPWSRVFGDATAGISQEDSRFAK